MVKCIAAAASWPIGVGGFFRLPKIAIVCGECGTKWITREYVAANNQGDHLADVCPSCNKWNLTDLKVDRHA